MRSFSRRLAWCSSRSGEPNTTGAIAMAVRKHTLDPYDPLQDLRVRAAWEGIPRFLERGKRHHRGVSANDSINRATAWPASSTHVWMHAILDGNTIEVIFNNRTAISAPYVGDLQEGDSGVQLFGVGNNGVKAQFRAWELLQANNFEI